VFFRFLELLFGPPSFFSGNAALTHPPSVSPLYESVWDHSLPSRILFCKCSMPLFLPGFLLKTFHLFLSEPSFYGPRGCWPPHFFFRFDPVLSFFTFSFSRGVHTTPAPPAFFFSKREQYPEQSFCILNCALSFRCTLLGRSFS